MATYVATPGNICCTFDAIKNVVLPFAHTALYVAKSITFCLQ
jgi:hypothetical protein